MGVSFNQIPGPSQLAVPGVYSEFDTRLANAGLAILSYNGLLIGQMLSAGTATANTVVRVTSPAQARTLFGVGSMLASMVEAYLAVDAITPLYCLPVADNGSGVAATGTVEFTAAATAAGTFNFYIGGMRVQMPVASGDSTTEMATALAAAINANTGLTVTATSATATVTITARHAGEVANSIDLRHSYQAGEALPAGVALTITAMSGGTGNPDLASISSGQGLAALPDDWYQIWASPYTDSANLQEIHREIADRYDPQVEQWAAHVTGVRGTFNQNTALGALYPQLFYSTINSLNDTISNVEVAVAQLAAHAAFNLAIDPARPLGGIGTPLVLPNVLPKSLAERMTFNERNQLLFAGIGTVKVNNSNQVVIERMITTYQQDTSGNPNDALKRIETLATLWYLAFSLDARITTKYPRAKLADSGFEAAPGQQVMTPDVMRAEYEGISLLWRDAALVENIDTSVAESIFQRNSQDVDRLDTDLRPDVVNQFLILANKISFIL